MARPPLHPNSVITQAEADELDSLLAAFNVAHADMLSRETALNNRVRTASTGSADDEAVDLFHDGRRKKRHRCVHPSGRGLPALTPRRVGRRRRKARRAQRHDQGEDRVTGRRHASAVVTADQMRAAERGVAARRRAYNDRNAASSALIPKIQALVFGRSGVPLGKVVDIWGAGLVVPAGTEVVPQGLVRIRNKRVD